MQVYKVEKKLRLTKEDAVKYQLITELIFLKKDLLIDSDLNILTLLAIWGPMELSKFCNESAKKLYVIEKMEEFSVKAQNIRNRISKLQKRNLIDKNGKQIKLSDSLNVFTKGNILIDYNFLATE
jgi:hypothetical protein